MTAVVSSGTITAKTRDLCQSILDDASFQGIRKQIDAFFANEKAQNAYQQLVERGEHLQHKQSQGVRLTDEEVATYETLREEVFSNPTAKNFIDAQKELHELQEAVQKHLSKTFELGRLPTEEELSAGGCGEGCGCH